jgi:dTMP kinase
MSGLFITLEGIEGAGKSTIAERLDMWLRKQDYQTIVTREPGGTKVGEKLREIIINKSLYKIPIENELLLIESARAQIMDEVVLPNLGKNKTVILDRHCDSTTAYQGYGRGIDLNFIAHLNNFSTRGRKPNLTLLLDLDVETGLSRARTQSNSHHFQDRFESETSLFMQRVRDGFLHIAEENPDRVVVIDAINPVDLVWQEIQDKIKSKLNQL